MPAVADRPAVRRDEWAGVVFAAAVEGLKLDGGRLRHGPAAGPAG